MIKKLFHSFKLISATVGILISATAESSTPQTIDSDTTLTVTTEATIEQFAESLDSLVGIWYMNSNPGLVMDTIYNSDLVEQADLSDSVYIKRLENIISPFKLNYNSHVKAYINLYTNKRREQVETMLGLSDYYFPIFEAALDAKGLPLELKYLPIIESALNPRAFSRAGASGLWQFMYYTGKQYGLEVNSYVDERRDPHKSTQAAVEFLDDLYNIYGDWQLVIAAYNCGPGNVNRAIRRSGGKRNFWEIFYLLPRETRGYVPAFIAATYVFTYHREHNLRPVAANLPVASDTVMISKPLHFSQVSDILQVPIDVIRHLNPQYRKDIIPAQKDSYPLRLAFNLSTQFASLEDSVLSYNREKYFPENQLVIKPGNTSTSSFSPPPGKEKIYYTVKSGDVVGLIADWFDVYSSSLRYWNNIRRNVIRVGQKLVIYVDKDKVDHYQRIAQQKSGYTASASTANQLADTGNDGDYIYHTVGRGDSVWSIAREYPGVTDSDILRLNNITNAQKIKPGQRLKIKPKS
ncbi:lytic transglycosylase domain-containing protein [Marinilabilia salmonicolor]|jgi:membrane-bound lytic murein transglycosylase D|uniref:Membrane-bound lytic murein transglycosylase D n=1 Tax=Marinilabilia salmonicolor TaxID=989 RepID=A0A2T0XQJ9_9BACT|nr:lytic transglycosylase domain-containing protein [Marinilabilia salmonicolor]PRZ01206.1 membrane-bound lytic murein transglycosylase D [Marinilabilia salmonicolor]RCW39398.1 membrane-bound lytic murein transglycosylase D [Marinilabilia salmonicolor]